MCFGPSDLIGSRLDRESGARAEFQGFRSLRLSPSARLVGYGFVLRFLIGSGGLELPWTRTLFMSVRGDRSKRSPSELGESRIASGLSVKYLERLLGGRFFPVSSSQEIVRAVGCRDGPARGDEWIGREELPCGMTIMSDSSGPYD